MGATPRSRSCASGSARIRLCGAVSGRRSARCHRQRGYGEHSSTAPAIPSIRGICTFRTTHRQSGDTRDRALIPGVGFSIEPGVYLAGDVGMRSEVNAFIGTDGLLITPSDYQKELMIV